MFGPGLDGFSFSGVCRAIDTQGAMGSAIVVRTGSDAAIGPAAIEIENSFDAFKQESLQKTGNLPTNWFSAKGA
jgi:hypothetical protein